MSDVTNILNAIEGGNTKAAEQLLPLVYNELRNLAAAHMAREAPGQTLDATALVHEAYLRLVGTSDERTFANSRHFFAAAAEAMRRILVDRARRKRSIKQGGELRRVQLADLPADPESDNLLELNDALIRLAEEDAAAAKVVELRHFAGLDHERIAETLGITVYQARQKWTYAKTWLRHAIGAK